MLEKSFVYPDNITYRPSREDDYAQLIRAWKVNFSEDSDAYIRDYFKTYYQPENTWVAVNEGMIISIVHLRPVTIINHGFKQTARYIEGVSTHFMFRHQGYMKTLITKAMAALPCDFYLLQAYQWEIYDFLEFSDYTYKLKVIFDQPMDAELVEYQEEMDPQHCLGLYQSFVQDKNGYPFRDEVYYKHLKNSLSLTNQGCIECADGYLIYEIMEGQCVVVEAIVNNKFTLKSLLDILIKRYQKIIALLETQYKDYFNSEEILFLKAKKGQSEVPEGTIYFNEYI